MLLTIIILLAALWLLLLALVAGACLGARAGDAPRPVSAYNRVQFPTKSEEQRHDPDRRRTSFASRALAA